MKILDGTNDKAYLEQVAANATQLNAEDRTQLSRLLQYFQEVSDETLLDWDTDTSDLELKPDSRKYNCKYYPFPRIIKYAFSKDLQYLVKI